MCKIATDINIEISDSNLFECISNRNEFIQVSQRFISMFCLCSISTKRAKSISRVCSSLLSNKSSKEIRTSFLKLFSVAKSQKIKLKTLRPSHYTFERLSKFYITDVKKNATLAIRIPTSGNSNLKARIHSSRSLVFGLFALKRQFLSIYFFYIDNDVNLL